MANDKNSISNTDKKPLASFRFIPFRKSDLVSMCLENTTLNPEKIALFETVADSIEEYFSRDFYQQKKKLKAAYSPVDPNADTREIPHLKSAQETSSFQELLETVLERANYERVEEKGLQKALNSTSLFQVRLHVDLKDFEEVVLYTRGASKREEELSEFWGLWKRKVKFINFDRVVLFIRFSDSIDTSSALGSCAPGATMLKLFQDVPQADLEMLFPNIRVGMRWMDRLLIGVPALVSGGLVVSTKLGATLLLVSTLIGFWLGVHNEPVELDQTALIALVAGFGALVGYVWKQWSNFRNRKLKYTQALTENLYFKLLDNNAGVIHRVIDDAEESEFKESVLAYFFLLEAGEPLTAAQLDANIEQWYAQKWQCEINFEIGDALDKLQKLDLARCEEECWIAVEPS